MVSDSLEIGLEYEPATGTYHTYHEPGSSITTTVLRGVATLSETDATEMEPLFETVDPDALDRLVESFPADQQWNMVFSYHGYDVSIEASGRVELSPK